jgi:hypothetical protein
VINQALGNRAAIFPLSEQGGERVLDAINAGVDGVFGFSVWAELAHFDLSRATWTRCGCGSTPATAAASRIRRLVAVGSRDTVTRDEVVGARFDLHRQAGLQRDGALDVHITHRTDTGRYGHCVGRRTGSRGRVLTPTAAAARAGGLARHRLAVADRGYWTTR